MALAAEKEKCVGYSRQSYFLQLQKYVFSTEIQVLPSGGNSDWFTEDQLTYIFEKLEKTLSKRLEEGSKTKSEMELFEGSGLLIASRFQKSNSKDSILLSKEQLRKCGMKKCSSDTTGGDYVHFYLFPERLIVTVSVVEQIEDFHNVTLCHRDVNTSISEYFQEIEKLSLSGKKRTNSLKKCITGEAVPSEVIEVKDGCHENKSSSTTSRKLRQKLRTYKREKPQTVMLGNNPSSAMKTRSKIQPSQQQKSKPIENFFKGSTDHVISPRKKICSEVTENHDRDGAEGTGDEDVEVTSENPSVKFKKNAETMSGCDENTKQTARKRKSLSDDEDFSDASYHPSRKYKKPKLTKVAKNKSPSYSKNKETKQVLKDNTNAVPAVESNKSKKEFSIRSLLESKRKGKQKNIRLEEIKCLPMCELNNELNEDVDGEGVNMNNIRKLTVQQVRDFVRSLEHDLRQIFEGKVPCERHEKYKKGGKEKDSLKFKTSFGLFTEAQEDCIATTLIEIFCGSHRKYFDYVFKVLIPEAIAMIYAKVENVSREEAERIIRDL